MQLKYVRKTSLFPEQRPAHSYGLRRHKQGDIVVPVGGKELLPPFVMLWQTTDNIIQYDEIFWYYTALLLDSLEELEVAI